MGSYLGGFDSGESGPAKALRYAAPKPAPTPAPMTRDIGNPLSAPSNAAPIKPQDFTPKPAPERQSFSARPAPERQVTRPLATPPPAPALRTQGQVSTYTPSYSQAPQASPQMSSPYSSPFASPPQQVYRDADFGNNAISSQSANGANDPPPQYGSRPLRAASGYGANPTPGGLVTGAGVDRGQSFMDWSARKLLGDSYVGRAGNEGTPVPQDGTPIQGRQDYNTQLANSNFGINRGKPVYVRGQGWTFPYGRGDGENRQTAPIYASDMGRQEGWRPSQGQVSYGPDDVLAMQDRRTFDEEEGLL